MPQAAREAGMLVPRLFENVYTCIDPPPIERRAHTLNGFLFAAGFSLVILKTGMPLAAPLAWSTSRITVDVILSHSDGLSLRRLWGWGYFE